MINIKSRFLLFAIFWLLIPMSLVSSLQLEKSIRLQRGPLTMVVEYPSGQVAQARYILARAAVYLPAVERYLDRPFPRRDRIGIRIVKKGGSNKGSRIEIGPGKPGHPALVIRHLKRPTFRHSK